MEEILNAVTHGVGAFLALVGLVVGLIILSTHDQGVWHFMSFSIYGVSLVLLFLASTLYHSFRNVKLKYIFKIVDHAAIFLLIAGTYTPFTLVPLHGTIGWVVFTVIWGLAGIGIGLQFSFVNKYKLVSTICYILMGWLIVVAIKPLGAALPTPGLWWLLAGGILYTVGAVFYLAKRLPYSHMIWHLFVLAGSAAHYISIFCYVLPLQIPG